MTLESKALIDLADRARSGDEQALEKLLTRLHAPVTRFLERRLQHNAAAQFYAADVAADTLVRVTGSLDQCRASSDREFMAWILTIARNAALDLLRKGFIRYSAAMLLDGLASEHRPDDFLTEVTPTDRAIADILAQSYGELSPASQELAWLHAVQGSSWREIADALGTTQSGAKRRWQRIQARLRRAVLARLHALPQADQQLVNQRLRGLDGGL